VVCHLLLLATWLRQNLNLHSGALLFGNGILSTRYDMHYATDIMIFKNPAPAETSACAWRSS